jgi:hypothetical protein
MMNAGRIQAKSYRSYSTSPSIAAPEDEAVIPSRPRSLACPGYGWCPLLVQNAFFRAFYERIASYKQTIVVVTQRVIHTQNR